ncbi:MAG: hypothetical protein HOC63_11815 [Rhodospirillales bacterium]|nr:hypothetical protein [Rhodospirillales bacterium]MBT4627364.1 hypothetical protein [Rhodospirillales bacterium]MBT5350906.1 hypothetical protein [Rhodospirillales bacterium]MBT6110816.1 hypothetical protein [Rhodospirillales bacterium]MBT7147023.1 hypothetical protein [Rhodospirillales bacterium]
MAMKQLMLAALLAMTVSPAMADREYICTATGKVLASHIASEFSLARLGPKDNFLFDERTGILEISSNGVKIQYEVHSKGEFPRNMLATHHPVDEFMYMLFISVVYDNTANFTHYVPDMMTMGKCRTSLK